MAKASKRTSTKATTTLTAAELATQTYHEHKNSADDMAMFEAHQGNMRTLIKMNESLHPDLLQYADAKGERMFWVVRHPLLVTGWTNNALLNYQYTVATLNLAEAEAAGDWARVIGVHAPPYRFAAFWRVADKLSDRDFWEFGSEIFRTIENAWQCRAEIRRFLTSNRPDKQFIMNLKERKKLAKLPEAITIYRGYGKPAAKLGWSWTTAPDKADWYANRFAVMDGIKPHVISGIVAKSDVIAYFDGGDDEIVVDPKVVAVANNAKKIPSKAT